MAHYRSLKYCLLLIPLVGYIFIMNGMLGDECFRVEYDSSITLDPSAQHVEKNTSRILHKLTETYDNLEKQRRQILNKIQNVLASDDDIAPRHSAFGQTLMGMHLTKTRIVRPGLIRKPSYLFNCSNIHLIKIKKKVGHGVSKQTFLGEYRGVQIAIKMVTRHLYEVKACLEEIKPNQEHYASKRSKCFVHPSMKLMKEILLLEQLEHHNLVRLLGYCVRSEESDSTDLSEHGIVAVYELGRRFVLDNLQMLPWQVRLKHAIELTRLLVYLDHSPLGSLRVQDFKEGHFLLVNDSIKMTDLDDVDNLEPSCGPKTNINSTSGSNIIQEHVHCDYGLKCRMALCLGHNAKTNIKHMNRLFYKRLLFPNLFPESMINKIGQLNVHIDSFSITASELLSDLLKLKSTSIDNEEPLFHDEDDSRYAYY